MRRALFPGSFDPITKGHEDIILRGLTLFDELVIGVGSNTEKNYMFPTKKRINFIKKLFVNEKKIIVNKYNGLTVDFCKSINASYILRGLRNPADFEFEKAIAHTNRKLSGIETIFLLTSAKTSYISSGIVREIIINKGDYKSLVPSSVRL
ncbi:MAG: pantetheine-phosphate adenylyltransferase [Flavobacteriaceae bacterium]|nr:pantetheine-phosphate adenylyltransferase [Flavobacteriaceae bacterium]|tara:strand:- start:11557 stop:12009 length:453 start_codon:yes stop_codon:yes gene_type:complete